MQFAMSPERCKKASPRSLIAKGQTFLHAENYETELGCGRAHRGLTVGFRLLQHSVIYTVESLSLFYLLFISRFVFTRR